MKKLAAVAVLALSILLAGCTKSVENTIITVSMNGTDVEGAYTGALDSDKATGEAKFVVQIDDTSSWVYEGSFKQNKMAGKGSLKGYPTKITCAGKEIDGVYNGETKDGQLTGKGTFVDSKDDIEFSYEGAFANGALAGEGKLKYDKLVVKVDGEDREGIYDGATVDGLPGGTGSFKTQNTLKQAYTYTGEWSNGLWNGQGECAFKDITFKGQYTNGSFTPTKTEIITSLGTYEDTLFVVPAAAEEFIKKHENFFTAKKAKPLKKYTAGKFNYKKLMKVSDKSGNKLVRLDNYHVVQIEQYDKKMFGGTFHQLLLNDNNTGQEAIIVYYPGPTKGIYADSNVTLYALPINSSSYKMVGGGSNNCYVLYGCYIQKL